MGKGGKSEESAVAAVKDYRLLHRPAITEKTSLAGGDGGEVVFYVDPRADKAAIKSAVERVFKVKVASVRTCNCAGKRRRTTGRFGRTASKKKAYIRLKEGYSISVVEGL